MTTSSTPETPSREMTKADYDELALQSDLAALRLTLPVIEGSGSMTTTVSVSLLRRLYDAAVREAEAAREARAATLREVAAAIKDEAVFVPLEATKGWSAYEWTGWYAADAAVLSLLAAIQAEETP